MLTYDPNSSNPLAAMAVYQQEDLVSLAGQVIVIMRMIRVRIKMMIRILIVRD